MGEVSMSRLSAAILLVQAEGGRDQSVRAGIFGRMV